MAMYSVLTGRIFNLNTTGSTTYHSFGRSRNTTTQADVYMDMPDAFTVSRLHLRVTTAPGVGKSWTFTLQKNGSDTAVVAVISGTDTQGTDTTNSVTYAAGDTFNIKCVPSGTPTAAGSVIMSAVTYGDGQIILMSSNSGSSISPRYIGFQSGSSDTSDAGRVDAPSPGAGTLSKFYFRTSAAPGSGTSYTTTLDKNGSASGITATVSDTNTLASDTTNSTTIAAGDTLRYTITKSGSPATIIPRVTMLFVPTTSGESIFTQATPTVAGATTTYSSLTTDPTGFDTTESNVTKTLLGDGTLTKFYVKRLTAAGSTWTGTVRENGVNTALSLSVTNVTTVQSVTTNVTSGRGDYYTIGMVPSGSPSSYVGFGTLFTANAPKDLMSTFTDNFDDNSIDAAKWTQYGSGTKSETSQQMQISTVLAGDYSGVQSLNAYDLTGTSAFVELANAGNQSITSLEVYLLVTIDSSNYVAWLVAGNTLYAYKKVAGSATQVFSVAYSSTTHKWLRIRESGGVTYWDTSTDGSSWTSRYSETNPISVSAVYADLQVGTWQAEGSTTTVIFDNFNVAGTPAPSGSSKLTLLGVG